MKNILLFLSFFLMALLGMRSVKSAFFSEGERRMETVLQTEESVEYILPSVVELPDEGEACVNMENLARQYRVIGRGQRSFSVQRMFFGKNVPCRAVRKRLEMLFHTIKNVYTSLPCQSWAVSSEYYIFGLRRILI